jgi:hypothetical protein
LRIYTALKISPVFSKKRVLSYPHKKTKKRGKKDKEAEKKTISLQFPVSTVSRV